MAESQTLISRDIFRLLRVGVFHDVFEFVDSCPELDVANVRNEDSETMLIYCVKRLGKEWTLPFGGEYGEICESLIKRNIDMDQQDLTGNTAAHYAVDFQFLKVLTLMMRNGARLDIRREDSLSALDLIAERGDLDWILAIFTETSAREEHIISVEGTKCALFQRLLSTNHLSCIQWICRYYPELIEAKNETSMTNLHAVVTKNNANALEIILGCGANTEAVDNEGHTALHFAVVYGHIDCLVILLKNGAKLNCQDAYQRTPLHYAVGRTPNNDDAKLSIDKDTFTECLLNYDASMTLADSGGRLPLHWAANTDNAHACEMMISKGCPVNGTSNEGFTALHVAASAGHAECIRVLVVNGKAKVNSPDNNGHAPLFHAINMEHIDCAELLLYGGALPNNCNKAGVSSAHLAATKNLTSALEILHKYEGSLELEDMDGNRPLHKAVLYGQLDAVDYMLKCKCRVDVRNKERLTPLHLAASVGVVEVCSRLLEEGASVNDVLIQYQNGVYHFLTALDMANGNNQTYCQQRLKSSGGLLGQRVADRAARNIQRCWRKKHIVQKETQDEQYNETNGTEHIPETDDNQERTERECTLTTNSENGEVGLSLSCDNFENLGTIGESLSQNEDKSITRQEVNQEPEIPKDIKPGNDPGNVTTSSNHGAEQIQMSENDGKATQCDKGKSKFTSKKSGTKITGKKSLVSSATQGGSRDKHDQSDKEHARKEEHGKVVTGLSDGKCNISSSSGLCKATAKSSKIVQQRNKASQRPREEKRVLGSTERKNSKLSERKDVVAASSKGQRVAQAGLENRKIKSTQQSSRSCEDESQRYEECLNETLNIETSRTEKLEKEIVILKKSLDERCHSLEERLKVVELKLRYT